MSRRELDLKRQVENLQSQCNLLSEMIGAMEVREVVIVGRDRTESKEVIITPVWVIEQIKHMQSVEEERAHPDLLAKSALG